VLGLTTSTTQSSTTEQQCPRSAPALAAPHNSLMATSAHSRIQRARSCTTQPPMAGRCTGRTSRGDRRWPPTGRSRSTPSGGGPRATSIFSVMLSDARDRRRTLAEPPGAELLRGKVGGWRRGIVILRSLSPSEQADLELLTREWLDHLGGLPGFTGDADGAGTPHSHRPA
jgi:hypothetical protein